MYLRQSLNFFLTCLALMILVKCQNLGKNKCEDTNWRQQAYIDALNGQSLHDFDKTQQQCLNQYNIEIKKELYKEGFEMGLVKLCNKKTAFQFGLEGLEYNGTCAKRDEKDFLQAYRKGRLQHLRMLYNKKTKRIQSSESRVWRKQNEYELEANTNPQAAQQVYDVLESYRAELFKLQKQRKEIKTRIDELTKLLN